MLILTAHEIFRWKILIGSWILRQGLWEKHNFYLREKIKGKRINEIIQEETEVEKRKLLKINLVEYLHWSEEGRISEGEQEETERWELVQYGVADA